MKTAIQELLEIVEMEYNNGVEISMKAFYGMLKGALEKEKQQIIEAYCRAEDKSEFFEYEHRYGREYLTAEPYYDETYD